MSGESSPFSVSAGDLRRSQVEMRTYAEALAERLERALPDRVTVERRRDGLFSRTTQLVRLEFRGDRAIYRLVFGRGSVEASKAKVVHGISISSTVVPPADWLNELGAELRVIAEQTGDANRALLDFL